MAENIDSNSSNGDLAQLVETKNGANHPYHGTNQVESTEKEVVTVSDSVGPTLCSHIMVQPSSLDNSTQEGNQSNKNDEGNKSQEIDQNDERHGSDENGENDKSHDERQENHKIDENHSSPSNHSRNDENPSYVEKNSETNESTNGSETSNSQASAVKPESTPEPASLDPLNDLSEPFSRNDDDDEEDDDDDDYDPESLPYSLADISSAPNSSAPNSSADATHSSPHPSSSSALPSITPNLLESVLSQYGKSDTVHSVLPSGNVASSPLPLSSHHPSSSAPPTLALDYLIDIPLSREDKLAYERFLDEEEEYVASGRWERFPYGSRMFVGNLPSERVTKAQLFKLFRPFGRVAQIVMKQAYGFIQFHERESVVNAMESYREHTLRGNNLQLEVSKPQIPRNKDTRNFGMDSGTLNWPPRPRSRSPPPVHARNTYRERDFGPGYDRGRSDPRLDMRFPPRRTSGYNRVPECHIFLLNRLDNRYVSYVENAFREAGIVVEVETLPPQVSLNKAIQQLAYEGVLAVAILDYALQELGKINIQVFDRNDISGNVRFDEYLKISPHDAVQLVQRVKTQQVYRGDRMGRVPPPMGSPPMGGPPMGPSIGGPLIGGPPMGTPPMGKLPANSSIGAVEPSSNLLGTLQNMDPANLQQVIYALQSRAGGVQGQPGFGPATSYGPGGEAGSSQVGGAGYQGQFPQSQPSGGTQQVQNIMDQLTRLQGAGH